MGIFDWFSNTDAEDFDSPPSFSNFSSKIVKVICRKDTDGVTKCEKFTQSSSDPSNSSYEETHEKYTQNEEEDLKNAFNTFGFRFGFGPNLFSEIEKEFEHLFNHSLHSRSPFAEPFFSHPENPFKPSSQEAKSDTNIYDI